MPREAPYRVVFTGPAARSLNKIPPRVLPDVLEFVYGRLQDDPYHVSYRLGPPWERLRGSHHAEYRIRLAIDDERRTVVIHDIDRRADAWRVR